MISLGLNEKYPLPVPIADGARAVFLTNNANTLQIKISQLSKNEIKDIKKGSIFAGIRYKKGNILLLFQFLKTRLKK